MSQSTYMKLYHSIVKYFDCNRTQMGTGGYNIHVAVQAKNVCLTECKYRNENSLKLFFCFHMG